MARKACGPLALLEGSLYGLRGPHPFLAAPRALPSHQNTAAAPFRGLNRPKRCRPGVRWRSSELDAQPPGRTRTLTGRAKSAQTLDQHGVSRKGDRTVDQQVEHLVVPGGAHVEAVSYTHLRAHETDSY